MHGAVWNEDKFTIIVYDNKLNSSFNIRKLILSVMQLYRSVIN